MKKTTKARLLAAYLKEIEAAFQGETGLISYRVAPRYTSGSPASVSAAVAAVVAVEEEREYERALGGVYGRDMQAAATIHGNRDIVIVRLRKRGVLRFYDVLTRTIDGGVAVTKTAAALVSVLSDAVHVIDVLTGSLRSCKERGHLPALVFKGMEAHAKEVTKKLRAARESL